MSYDFNEFRRLMHKKKDRALKFARALQHRKAKAKRKRRRELAKASRRKNRR